MPCPPPGDLPNPGTKARSPTLQADSLPSEAPGKPTAKETLRNIRKVQKIYLKLQSQKKKKDSIQEKRQSRNFLGLIKYIKPYIQGGFTGDSVVGVYECRRCGFDSRVGKTPWKRKWQPTPVFLPGKSYGQRSLADYSPWCHKGAVRDLETKQQHLSKKPYTPAEE